MFNCVKSNLESITVQAEALSDPEYLMKQSARDLAMLHGVMFDKALRLLGAVDNQKTRERIATKD